MSTEKAHDTSEWILDNEQAYCIAMFPLLPGDIESEAKKEETKRVKMYI